MNSVRAGHVVLEPQTAAHAAEMYDVLRDPKIYEFENSPPVSSDWLAARFAKLESRLSPDGTQQWLNWVVRVPTGALAGYVQATIDGDGTAHIAYELASPFWRQGIGRAACRELRSDCVRGDAESPELPIAWLASEPRVRARGHGRRRRASDA
jgi:[ribosomal protein S5]-alanine N-acetyltransferase